MNTTLQNQEEQTDEFTEDDVIERDYDYEDRNN